jgi:hypothetical protein
MNTLNFLTYSVLIIFIIWILWEVARIQSNMESDYRNIRFLDDILYNPECGFSSHIQERAQRIIQFHQKWNVPLLIERSIKVHRDSKAVHVNRFTIPLSLSCFITQDHNIDEERWQQWWDIFDESGIPEKIGNDCIDAIACNRGEVDFIWGVDGDKEKIYIEDPDTQTIQLFVITVDPIKEYKYTRESLTDDDSLYIAKYTRWDGEKKNAEHYQYREPKRITDQCSIYLKGVEFDESGRIVSDTYYIRMI